MKDTSPIPDHATFKEGTYAHFHFQMIGKQFHDRNGQILSKLEVFIEYRNQPDILNAIVNGRFTSLQTIDKPGWGAGILNDRRAYYRTADGELKLG